MSAEPLSILAVTSELPWPLDTGGHLRTFHLLSALAADCHVRLVTSAASGVSIAALQGAGIDVRIAHDGRRRPAHEAARALRAAVRFEPYVMYGRHDWTATREALRGEARTRPPDILYLDHLDSFAYAAVAPEALLVGDLHNVYSLLAARATRGQRSLLRRAYLSREARLLARMERRAVRRADLILTVSRQEEEYFRRAGARGVCVVPNGVDCARYASLPTGRSVGAPIILYIGAMSWEPNVAAACFLSLDVLPAVRRRFPDARVRIVGRDPPREVLQLSDQPGVEVTGRVDDVLPSLCEAHVLAVPLDAGGGTRLKILEAFAAGLPVVSTPVGCEGIDAQPGRHLLVATRDRFADAVVELLQNPARVLQMADRARSLAHDVYDWPTIGSTAVQAIRLAHEKRGGA